MAADRQAKKRGDEQNVVRATKYDRMNRPGVDTAREIAEILVQNVPTEIGLSN